MVRVRDNGLGISADLLPRVFDLFIQADRSLARSEGGLGVGLTLVRSLVEMHGGAVEAHSEGPGRGSEFVVRLPVAADLPRPAADPAAGRAPPGAPDPPRVLIVDDNVDAAESAAELLRLSGCEVRTVHDGPAAAAEAVAFRPRVILLDIGLPGMNGYEVARRIRRELGREVVLVAVTGYGQDEDRRRAEEAGFDHHLVKPVAPTALIELTAALSARQ